MNIVSNRRTATAVSPRGQESLPQPHPDSCPHFTNQPTKEAGVGTHGRRAPDKPVPLAPRHRRNWTRWGRYCVCGLRWPCPDRRATVPVEEPPPPPPALPPHRDDLWNAPTAVHWVGAANLVTRGQAYRANGGRR